MSRLRLVGAVRYYGHHLSPDCEGMDPETCECGYAVLLERLEETTERK